MAYGLGCAVWRYLTLRAPCGALAGTISTNRRTVRGREPTWSTNIRTVRTRHGTSLGTPSRALRSCATG
eukprot:2241320-Prymnesium_polylepis.1